MDKMDKINERIAEITAQYHFYKGAVWAITELEELVSKQPDQSQEVLKDVLPAKHPAPAKKKGGRKPKATDEEVKRLFDEGLTSQEIAAKLGMTTQTVNKKLLSIKAKEVQSGS